MPACFDQITGAPSDSLVDHLVRNRQDGYPYLILSLFCCWKYTETSIFLVKLIVQWIPDCDGRGIARVIKKIILIFKTWQKMVTKFGQFKKLKCREGSQLCKFSQLCKLSQLCYHFLSRFENENIFFYIPSNPQPIAVRNSLTNQFYQKNLRFCIFSKKRKNDKYFWDPSHLFSFAFFFLFKYTES